MWVKYKDVFQQLLYFITQMETQDELELELLYKLTIT